MAKGPKLASSAGLFEKRGDKWGGSSRPQLSPHNPTAAERAIDSVLKKMGTSHQTLAEVSARLREANRDDPDMDRWTKAGQPVQKQEYQQPPGTPIEADYQRRATNILLGMKAKTKGRPLDYTKRKPFTPGSGGGFVADNKKHEARGGRNRKKDKTEKVDYTAGLPVIVSPPLDPSSDDAKINKLMDTKGISREKAFQLLEAERKTEAERRANYAAKKFGR